MTTKTDKATEAQGAETPKTEKAEVTINQNQKKIQLSIAMLEELAEDSILRKHFIETVKEDEVKTPMAYQMAKMMKKQTELQLS